MRLVILVIKFAVVATIAASGSVRGADPNPDPVLKSISQTCQTIRTALESSRISGRYHSVCGPDFNSYRTRELEINKILGRAHEETLPNLDTKVDIFKFDFDFTTSGKEYALRETNWLKRTKKGAPLQLLHGFDGSIFYDVDLRMKLGTFSAESNFPPYPHPVCIIDGQGGENMPGHGRGTPFSYSTMFDWYSRGAQGAKDLTILKTETGRGNCKILVAQRYCNRTEAMRYLCTEYLVDTTTSSILAVSQGFKPTPNATTWSSIGSKVTFSNFVAWPDVPGAAIPCTIRIENRNQLPQSNEPAVLKANYPMPFATPMQDYVTEIGSYEITDIRPLPPGALVTQIPPGTKIRDHISNTDRVIQ